MNKFLLIFFPLFLFAEVIFPYTFSLKKDEIIEFKIYYKNFTFPLKFRWTLFKNDVLVVICHYNNFPRHIELFKDNLNTFKVNIMDYLEFYPYFLIKFEDFNDKIATFKMYLFRGKNIKVKRIR